MARHIVAVSFLLLLFPAIVFAQTPPPENQAELGCKIGWDAYPAGNDVDGYYTLLNNAAQNETWGEDDNARQIEHDDGTIVQLTCDEIGLTEIGLYNIGLRAYDTSRNPSDPTWLAVQVVMSDTEPPVKVLNLCLESTLKGSAVKLCVIDTPSAP